LIEKGKKKLKDKTSEFLSLGEKSDVMHPSEIIVFHKMGLKYF
jgi:hypothetical protein